MDHESKRSHFTPAKTRERETLGSYFAFFRSREHQTGRPEKAGRGPLARGFVARAAKGRHGMEPLGPF